MRRSRYKYLKANLRQSLPALLVVVVAGLIGLRALGLSSADTASTPIGWADYCELINGKTVLSGWAHDPNAAAGSLPNVTLNVTGQAARTLPTNLSYRESYIDTYLANKGYATSSIYGWQSTYSGLYKGGSYYVTGTIINVGAGSNANLWINTVGYSYNTATKPPFTGGKIPDTCLPSLPTPPAPAPTPTPTPTPSPTPTPKPSPSPTPKPSPKPTPAPILTPTPPSATGPSNAADAHVDTGTKSALLTIPAGSASKLHVTYSFDSTSIVNSDDQALSGDPIKISLKDLLPATTYQFQIVRTNSAGTSAISAVDTFTTKGYSVALHFTDSSKKPVQGVAASINDLTDSHGTSDKNGALTFKGLDEKTYTVTYTYAGKRYTKQVNLANAKDEQFNKDNMPAVITLSDTIQISHVVVQKESGLSKLLHNKNVSTSLRGLLLGVPVAFVIWLILRRRKRRRLAAEYSALSGYGNTPASPEPATEHHHHHPAPSGPLPEHAGESLRDMVILSMYNQGHHPSQTQGQVPQSIDGRSAVLPPQPPEPARGPAATHHPMHASEATPQHHTATGSKPTTHHERQAHPPHSKTDDDDEQTLRIDHRKPTS